MSQGSISLSIINKIENSIRESEKILYLINDHYDQLVDGLKQISIRSGMAIYVWLPQKGLTHVKSTDAPLPRTKTILDALKYANNNHYFSVYVFPLFEKAEQLEFKTMLASWKNLLEVNEKARYLFLLPANTTIDYLVQNGEEINLRNKNTNLYKLRNSIWVLTDD